MGRINIRARVFLVAEHLIDLGVFDGLSPLAGDAGRLHLRQNRGISFPVGDGVEQLPHIARLQFIDNIPLVHHIIAKGGGPAVVEGL